MTETDNAANNPTEQSKFSTAGRGRTLVYPSDLATEIEEGHGCIKFLIKERRNRTNETTVFLPLPENFQLSDSADYDDKFEKSELQAFLTGAGNLLTDLAGGGFTGARRDSVVADAAVTGLLLGVPEFVTKAIGAGGVGEIAFQQGAAVNNGERTKFNRNTTRSFDFSFKLSPRNDDEAKTIKDIINVFRTYTYASLGSNKLALNYPPEFLVQFIYKGQESEYMPLLFPALCEGIKVDYNPDTKAVFNSEGGGDGSPISYGLDISFVETKKLIREEIIQLEHQVNDKNRHETMYKNHYFSQADIDSFLEEGNAAIGSGEGDTD